MSDNIHYSEDRGVETGRSSGTAPIHVQDLIGYLRGLWLFERKVFDVMLNEEISANGTARYVDELMNGQPGLRYREDGELDLGNIVLQTEREYIYGFLADGGVAEVRFADGRFFHLLDLSKGMVRVEHQCGEDHYQGLFRVLTDQAWLSVWRVTGPRKSQVITTHFIRP
ncbi:MAG TPA: DUF6314 family protein [Magnetovibrio sp.]